MSLGGPLRDSACGRDLEFWEDEDDEGAIEMVEYRATYIVSRVVFAGKIWTFPMNTNAQACRRSERKAVV